MSKHIDIADSVVAALQAGGIAARRVWAPTYEAALLTAGLAMVVPSGSEIERGDRSEWFETVSIQVAYFQRVTAGDMAAMDKASEVLDTIRGLLLAADITDASLDEITSIVPFDVQRASEGVYAGSMTAVYQVMA